MTTRHRSAWRTLPLRVRLTATFAVVVGVALALTGLVVYLQFRASLGDGIDQELALRQATIVALARAGNDPRGVIAQSGEPLIQVYRPDGGVIVSSRLLRGVRLVDAATVRSARTGPRLVTRGGFPGFGDGARVRVFPIPGGEIAAIGDARAERERALHRLAAILVISLPGALVAACLAGYAVTRAALRPVEAMRARAEEIHGGGSGERLPEPGTRDEIDRLARTLNDLLGRLEAAVEQERRIVGDASHELRTPISVLLTRLDVALRDDGLDEAALRQVLAGARGDARRLSRLADDLLLLARADQGRLPLRPEPLEVHDLLAEALRRQAGGDGAVLVAREVAGGAVVLADRLRTGQVLDNLIANALVHGAPPVELGATMDDGVVTVSVRDHGPGYPEDFLPRAFERFSQAEAGGRGVGLGLSIARAIVSAQGGTIALANHAGGGAIVTFTLPAA